MSAMVADRYRHREEKERILVGLQPARRLEK